MPPLNTHLIIGERVFPHLSLDETVYGPFLLGCLLVDVNGFTNIDRRVTHFVGRLEEDGTDAFTKSCSNFLSQLDGLLRYTWDDLSPEARAFVIGYLCHLAADEPWKAWGMDIQQALNIDSFGSLTCTGECNLDRL